jgi:hypothetical protein
MKTCEQYVLKKLEEAERKVEEQEEFIKIFSEASVKVFEDLKVLLKHIEIKTNTNGNRYVNMEYVFEEYEPEDFKRIETMLEAVNYAEEMAEMAKNKGAD